ncbi:hypothetical protein BJX62DRAFT_245166 [Aspergillus germanicus]
MASLVIVAAIIVAVKSPDWIEQYKQHKAKKALNESESDSTMPPDYFGPSSDGHETTSGKRSKRDLLTRKYWHERKESRQSREQIQSSDMRDTAERRGSFEAPPPYNGPPGYQENEKREHERDSRSEHTVYYHCP